MWIAKSFPVRYFSPGELRDKALGGMNHQDIIKIICPREAVGEFFIQPSRYNSLLMVKEQYDVVIFCGVVVGEMIIDQTTVTVYS